MSLYLHLTPITNDDNIIISCSTDLDIKAKLLKASR